MHVIMTGTSMHMAWRIVALEVNGKEVCISIIDGCGIKHQNELSTAFVN